MNQDKLDDKTTLDGWFKLLEHHHQAMRSRRAIELSVFTGTMSLYLVLKFLNERQVSKIDPLTETRFQTLAASWMGIGLVAVLCAAFFLRDF